MIGVRTRHLLCKSITALALFLASGLALAQAPKTPLTLKPTAPSRYVVVHGDTLWGIAGRYTDSPWRWPELWRLNKEKIKNPDLIYPGDVIVLDRGEARLTLEKTVKLEPRVRDEGPTSEAIPSIPAKVIEPFLTRPLVVEPDGLDNAPTIVGTQDNHVVLGAGSRAYVEGIGDTKQETWYVYRRGPALVDPDTQRTLGYEGIYLGTARLVRAGEPATVELTSVTQEVVAGDKLIAAAKPQPVTYAPHAPAVFIKGRVISIYEGLSKVGEAGPQSIVALNRGKADGVDAGTVFALYRYGESVRNVYAANKSKEATIKLPDERYGLVFVFRVFDRVSYALVMRITKPVEPLDVVETP
ncbi:MAG: LysM domain-containing protein [Betaproteobacteria bacterium]|nr:LysM domain-containing protein [Betaproteobacteria bacterium]